MAWVENKEVMAANINYYLKAKGKTRKEACKEMNISYSTFTEWANGRKYPRIDKIELMAGYFGILKADLIEKRTALLSGKEIGEYIKKARSDNGQSLDQLASLIGVSVNTLKKLESGTVELTTDIVQRLHDQLNIPIEVLFGYTCAIPGLVAKEQKQKEQFEKWQEMFEGIEFTDTEFEDIIKYARFIVSNRK